MPDLGDRTQFYPVDGSNTTISAGSAPPSTIDNSIRTIAGAMTRDFDFRAYAVTSGGTSTAFTVTNGGNDPAALYDGQPVTFISHVSSGVNATLKHGALAAKTLKKIENGNLSNLVGGEFNVGEYVDAIYKTVPDCYVITNGIRSENSEILISASALSGGSFIVNNATILKAYKRFRIILEGASHNSGSSQTLQIALSGNNGSTWSTDSDFAAPVAAAALQGASLEIFNCHVASGLRLVTSNSVGSAQPTPYISSHSVTTGYINAIRFKPASNSWDGGTITVIGYA